MNYNTQMINNQNHSTHPELDSRHSVLDTESKSPKLRFKEFSGEWEEKKFKDVATFYNGKAYQQKELLDKGKYPVLRVGNFFTNNNWYYSDLELDENKYCDYGDLLYAWSASFGPRIWKGNKVIYHYHIWKVINNPSIIRDFLFIILDNETEKMKTNSSNGFALLHITKGTIENWNIQLPKLSEQQKIASFLAAIDTKIDQLTKKQTLLKQYKKGVMQKLFSQELRFKADDGSEFSEWEEKKISDVLKIGSGKDYKHLESGSIPVYGTGGYMLSVSDYLYEGESVCIGRKGTIDKPMFLNGKFWTVDTLFYTHSFKDSIPKFIFYVFQTINWKLYNEASGVPSLSKSTIEKIVFSFPSIDEQTKITNFLSTIDTKIDFATKQLEEVKKFKKGLLQQMFV